MFLINWLAKGRIIFCLRSFSPENVFISQSLFVAVLSLIPISIFFDGNIFLQPANAVCEGYVFTGVCLSTVGGGGRTDTTADATVTACGQ